MTDQRDPKMLRAYQRILNGQLINEGIYISMRDCQDLVGLISVLEEENKKLNDDANRVSNDIRSVVESMKPEDQCLPSVK